MIIIHRCKPQVYNTIKKGCVDGVGSCLPMHIVLAVAGQLTLRGTEPFVSETLYN